jgi:hypothetical protein
MLIPATESVFPAVGLEGAKALPRFTDVLLAKNVADIPYVIILIVKSLDIEGEN